MSCPPVITGEPPIPTLNLHPLIEVQPPFEQEGQLWHPVHITCGSDNVKIDALFPRGADCSHLDSNVQTIHEHRFQLWGITILGSDHKIVMVPYNAYNRKNPRTVEEAQDLVTSIIETVDPGCVQQKSWSFPEIALDYGFCLQIDTPRVVLEERVEGDEIYRRERGSTCVRCYFTQNALYMLVVSDPKYNPEELAFLNAFRC